MLILLTECLVNISCELEWTNIWMSFPFRNLRSFRIRTYEETLTSGGGMMLVMVVMVVMLGQASAKIRVTADTGLNGVLDCRGTGGRH